MHLSLLRHDVMHPGSLGPSLATIYAMAAEAAAQLVEEAVAKMAMITARSRTDERQPAA